jgi:hypothetical protein
MCGRISLVGYVIQTEELKTPTELYMEELKRALTCE